MDNPKIKNFSIINPNKKSYNDIKISLNDFTLYLDIIGGHSFFIEIPGGYLLKSTTDNEINFYNNSPSTSIIPHFYGVITKTDPQYEYITIYLNQCKSFFRSFLLSHNIKAEHINIENDSNFIVNFNNYINDSSNVYNQLQLNETFNDLYKKLEELNQDKLNWILFWFVKWKDNFLNYDYIILENLLYNMVNPAIIDIKLGSTPRISKELKIVKRFGQALHTFGCRIMGLQKGNVFINRYESRNYSYEDFINKIYLFFGGSENGNVDKELINRSLCLINNVKNEFEGHNKDFTIKFSSLLIVYDCGGVSDYMTLKVYLIDFSYYERIIISPSINNTNDKQCNDLIQAMDNLVNIISNLKQI